jgi:predicted DNA-binding protein
MNTKEHGEIHAMSKTVTLRLSDEEYERLANAAHTVKRPISNLISYLALQKIEEDMFADSGEMEEIFANQVLTNRLQRGHSEAATRKGRFVE